MIYFVQCNGPDGPVKIGWVKTAANLWRRMHEFSIGNPYPLSILGTIIDGTRGEEGDLHDKFNLYLIQGEWFTLSLSLQNYIKSHCLGGGAFHSTPYGGKRTAPR